MYYVERNNRPLLKMPKAITEKKNFREKKYEKQKINKTKHTPRENEKFN